MSLASKVLGSWHGKASCAVTSMSGFCFSNVLTSSSNRWWSIFALGWGQQLTVIPVLPSAALSLSELQAARPVTARAVATAAVQVRRRTELLIGGPL